MHKRMGANKRKQSGQRRHAWGGAIKKAATKGASISTVAIIAVCICGGAVIAAVKASAWISRSPMFTVATIRVEGAVRVDQAEAVRLSGIKPGMPMLSLHAGTSERALCTSAWVKTAHVARRFPGTVVIKIVERAPIALVNTGKVRYMDESGVLLPLFSGTYSNLPVVSGLGRDSGGCMPGAAVARVRGFLNGCTDGDPVMAHRISQIDFTSGTTALLTMEDFATTVEMTDADAGTEMRRLARLAQYGMAEPASQPARIDLRFENLAYVQK